MTKTFITLLMTILFSSTLLAQHHRGHHRGHHGGHGKHFNGGKKNFKRAKAIQAAREYIQALKQFRQLTQAKSLYGVSRSTANLIDTVKFSVLRPLNSGHGIKAAQKGLKDVHHDVRRLVKQIHRSTAGKKVRKKFQSVNQNEKIRLMRILNS